LAVCRDEGSVTVRFIRRPWDLYDPSLPILKGLSGIAGEFCYACLNLDRDLAYGTYVPADSSAGGMFCGYLAETAENIRNSGDCLCDLRQITGFLLDSLRESALFSDMDILFSDPTDNCGALIIPLHLSGLTYAFLLLMRMMGDLSTDGQVEVSLLTYEDRVDFRFACTSNLAASHLRYNRSFSGASEAVPGLRGPAELFSALCARHSFTAELLKNRGTLLCTVTVHEFTEHQPDFKFNDPMARIREFFSEALHVLSCLADVSEHQEGEAKGL